MKLKLIKYTIGFLLLVFSLNEANGQFYNGLQMSFGKNRVQFNNFYWQFYRFDKFDTYFNQDGINLAEYTAKIAEKKINELELFFDYTLEKRIILLVYNKLSDFRQSNIGLISGTDEYNTGGVTQIVNNKVFLYYEGDHKKFEQQITAAISEVIINEMLYGGDLKENITNSTLINLPDWYIKGLISYISDNWDVEIENRVKDAILTKKYDKFNRLSGQDAIYAGHSFWRYIAKTYGEPIIPNILYITRVNKNANSGFLYVIGSSVKELSNEWLTYYKGLYKEVEGKTSLPDSGLILKRPKARRVYQQMKVSPDSKFVAYTTNEMGQYKLWLFNTATRKTKRILKKEHKIDQITDYSYPVIAWHPGGKILTYITEENGGIKLHFYNVETKEKFVKNFLYFDKVLDYSFSADGQKLVISGVVNGKTDLFVHTLSSATNEQITNDYADDIHPKFIGNGDKIIFSSNRTDDTLRTEEKVSTDKAPNYDLYIYDYKNKPNQLTKITDEPYINKKAPQVISNNKYAYLSDANGIINRYIAEFDSAISFVDTSTHYRFFSTTYPLTNYSRNINEQDISTGSLPYSEILYNSGKYRLYKNDFSYHNGLNKSGLPVTDFRKAQLKELSRTDSLEKKKKEKLIIPLTANNSILQKLLADSLLNNSNDDRVDINKYIFEKEKTNYINDKLKEENIKFTNDTTNKEDKNKIRIYETSFYTNYLVTQVDFSFLNDSYQAYTGGAPYFNPGLSAMFKLGTNDLFEDYKVTGGIRLSTDLQSNEYLLSFENLKKRIDKQWIYHRQSIENSDGDTLSKTYSNEIMYVYKYPFSQVNALRGTFSLRNDREVFLSTDLVNLTRADNYKIWAGIKEEYIFDNTRKLGINIYSGTRYKLFGEAYEQVNKANTQLFVLGADFRHYQVIHRNLILASRFAASSSFGTAKLIYYLGAVDNWWYQLSRSSAFDNSVPVNEKQNYAYQTLATNMRGFIENVRNGNNFFVMNNEIRWPFVKYFMNRPISSNFWSSLQAIGFFDVGSAWAGISPYSGKNAYDKTVVQNGSLTITIDSNRDPIVAGYGLGFRAQILGYFMRFDWARGIENRTILPTIFYFSLSLDF
jgi:hypothetical protein